MKITIFIIILFPLSKYACSQNADSMFFDNVVNAEIATYYPNGSIKAINHTYNNKKNGQTITFFENGKIKKIICYSMDTLHGWQYEFLWDGCLDTKYYLTKNKKDKLLSTYWCPDGKTETEKEYRNGILFNQKSWDDQGNLSSIVQYDSIGKLIILKEYYKGEEMISEYWNGKKHGKEIIIKNKMDTTVNYYLNGLLIKK